MLNALLYFGMRAICAVGNAIDNENSKRQSRKIDANGNVTCYGNDGRYYVNGEKTYTVVQTDKYDHQHYLTVGENSGKVYESSFDKKMQRMRKYDEEEYQKSLKTGKAAYNKYDPRFETPVTTEISTGKIIACLFKDDGRRTGKVECRKFYWDGTTGFHGYTHTADGDLGVVISEDEYKSLNIVCSTFSCIPSDITVYRYLMGID